MNSLRDNLLHLKGFGDLITNSTTADTGAATYLSITRAASTDTVLRGLVTADTFPRLAILASGKHEWGTGAAAATSFLEYSGGSLTFGMPSTGSVYVQGGLYVHADVLGTGASGAFIGFNERTDTSVPGVNAGTLYMRDNGAGKTQLVAMFNTGAVQVIATQP